ncbi:hypothetical protein CRG98_032462 [Punica granatum]|uniref:Fe(2+) transport protein 1-like n=1 Tax=Punica granatum TaxID=22663 RepID=A0A2I0IT15_PUNGR|nr:hypothetical protein CRG98_032462 [Punica granatum]
MAINALIVNKLLKLCIFFLAISLLVHRAHAVVREDCVAESGSCIDKSEAQPLKIIAIVTILVTSMIGVSAPLFTKAFPALHPDRDLFVIVKAFAAGIILATGFMHVLPDSFDMLSSSCLSENPWHKFPFTGFVAMLSAILTLMVDSLATSIYSKKGLAGVIPAHQGEGASPEPDREMGVIAAGHFHGHHHVAPKGDLVTSQLLRYRVVAMSGDSKAVGEAEERGRGGRERERREC